MSGATRDVVSPRHRPACVDQHVVSVIVPTLGRATVARTRAAIGAQTRPPDELIVVPDPDRRGIGWARNEGIRRSRGDLIAFTDDDCVPPDDWLERLIEAIDREGAAGAGGTFAETDPLLIQSRRIRERQRRGPPVAGNGGNVMYARKWFEQCLAEDGCVFDESFRDYGAEDWEFAWRIQNRGARLVFVENPVTHLRALSRAAYLQHQFKRGIGIAGLFKAHRRAPNARPAQDSLLWGQPRYERRTPWLSVLWTKATGPLSGDKLADTPLVWWYWLGEQAQGLGFLWGLITFTARSGSHPPRPTHA
ncbi:MAG: glycosyltransferase [Acidobacteriota bacterium]